MGYTISRLLRTEIEIEHFVDNVLQIVPTTEKRDAIRKICSQENNVLAYGSHSTLRDDSHRDFEYRDSKRRETLRETILTELKDLPRLSDDDSIKLGIGGAKPPAGMRAERKAFYIIGPPASGKSKVSNILADRMGAYILDSDFAKRKLPEYTKEGGASLVHEESDEIVFSGENNLMSWCVSQSVNLVIPKIGHTINSINDICTGLSEKGYEVYLIAIDLDRQKATRRAYQRFIDSNRYVPLAIIFDQYSNEPLINYFRIKSGPKTVFSGFARISTDVPIGSPFELKEQINLDELKYIEWR
ncbi:zeta toxin family protein [Pygmaiobacter massiliensis]|uniref:zeta toxin family protein n=1 Tax=Pygmaiobacter massiliensis TaxID=1917873 RepID=UPI000C79FF8F|nr:zeta toxin family protein [Pygmaiobacter massiliensis]